MIDFRPKAVLFRISCTFIRSTFCFLLTDEQHNNKLKQKHNLLTITAQYEVMLKPHSTCKTDIKLLLIVPFCLIHKIISRLTATLKSFFLNWIILCVCFYEFISEDLGCRCCYTGRCRRLRVDEVWFLCYLRRRCVDRSTLCLPIQLRSGLTTPFCTEINIIL